MTEGGIVEGLASELIATREQLEIVLRHIDEGVVVVSGDGRLVYANDAAARLIGYASVDELVSAGFGAALERFIVHDEHGVPLTRAELPGRLALARGRPEEAVVHFRARAGGDERVSVVRAVPVLDDAGAVQFVMTFFREITAERRRAGREAFTAEAGGLLGSSLDYEATLRAVASLAVPRLADWCLVDLVGEDGSLQRVATAHADPAKEALSEELQRRWPWRLDDASGPGRVIRTGRSALVREVTDALAVAAARDEDHLRVMRAFGTTAALAVPIEARGRVLGAISLGLTSKARQFDDDDLELAAELGRRAGIAIDNAQLFRDTQRTGALLDALVDSAPVGVSFVDRDLRYVRINEALAEMNGLTPQEHIGRRIDEIVPDLEPAVLDLHRRVLETGEPALDVEVHGVTPAQPGVTRTWVGSYYPIRDPDGAVAGVGAVVTEVSARRRVEQRLAVQHAVNAILADAQRVGEAAPQMLASMCELLDWDVGVFWPVRGEREATAGYVHALPELEAFAQATVTHRIRPGLSLAGEIWESASPRWVLDMTRREDFPQREAALAGGIRSGFGFPAIAGGEVVGIIEFFARAEREPDPELLAVVESLGRSIGQFVRRRRAEVERGRLLVAERLARSEAEASAATLQKLAQVAEVALTHRSLRDLLDAFLSRIVDVLAADTGVILLLDGAGANLEMRAAVGLGEAWSHAVPIPLGHGLAGKVAASRRPLLVDDLEDIALVSPVLRERGIKSVVAIPLVIEDRVIGVLHAGSEELSRFTHDDARLLELIADRISLAINQAALYEAERVARARLAFLAEATSLLASSLDYEETLAAVAQLAVPHLADWCAVDMVADDGAIARLAVAHVDPAKIAWAKEIAERFPPDPDDPSPYGLPHVLRAGEPVLMPELPRDLVDQAVAATPELAEVLEHLSLNSLMIVPLVARGRTLGALTFVWAESGNSYDTGDLEYAQELAARAAVAVDNARLYRAAEEGRQRLGFLAEASALLGSALDPDEALAQLGNLVAGRIADWCSIHLVDEQGEPRLVTISHTDPEHAAAARAYAATIEPDPGATEGVGHVIRTGEPELWPEIPQELLTGPSLEAGIHSSIIVPLVARGRTLGALTLVWAETHERYTEADLAFAQDLARRAAVAIDNAQLYREAAERAQAARVLASVGDGVVLVDSAGIVRYWNRAAETITGLDRASVIDRPIAEAVPGWATVAARVQLASDPAVSPRAESLPLALGTRELWLSISGVAVTDGTVYAFRDLTEERALEQMKTEFVSTVSHELRTPLAAIYGAAMTLRRSDVTLDEIQHERLLHVISTEADRLARIVNDILWASRIDSDTVKMAIESCDARELTEEVVAAQRTHLPEGVAVEIVTYEPLPPVAADPDKVRRVLVNLVENAVKYSPDGGRVIVRLEAVGGQVRFVVTDQGLGIPYAEQRRIFEKFYRLDPNMTRGIGGTGLGLYICRELVRRMDGRIWVTSEPGRGSTFAFELPIAGADSDVIAHAGR